MKGYLSADYIHSVLSAYWIVLLLKYNEMISEPGALLEPSLYWRENKSRNLPHLCLHLHIEKSLSSESRYEGCIFNKNFLKGDKFFICFRWVDFLAYPSWLEGGGTGDNLLMGETNISCHLHNIITLSVLLSLLRVISRSKLGLESFSCEKHLYHFLSSVCNLIIIP